MNIPKIIHYCWFGGNPFSDKELKCIDSWKKFFPDYEIKEWNESNFDLNCCEYIKDAYKLKKWAFVSDYARFYVLYHYGGLYFDTDVEIIKPLDDLIEKGSFMGKEMSYGCNNKSSANPGLGLAAAPGLGLYKEILDLYNELHFSLDGNIKTVVDYTTDILKKHGFEGNNHVEEVAGIYIYPTDYFCPLDCITGRLKITENTRAIHWYSASWQSQKQTFINKIKKQIKYILGPRITNVIISYKQRKKERNKEKNKEKYNIYISTYGYKKTVHVDGGIPIEVGANSRSIFYYPLKDNCGDNISDQNEYFGELTGLYWIWKNISNFEEKDIIGFCHYNKTLDVSKKTAISFLQNGSGWIVAEPVGIQKHPFQDEIQAIEQILKEYYPQYYKTWKLQYNLDGSSKGKICFPGNMFITTYAQFREYCLWLFDILFKMRDICGDKPFAGKMMKRYCAFMGERLLGVYLYTNSNPIKSVELRFNKWWYKYVRRVIKKINIKNNSNVYRFLRHKFGYKSSYKK